MAAPATAGKYVSGLSGMAIDDYIKCVYEAPYDNVAGYFSQLGNKEPWIEVHTTTNGGEEVVTKEQYTELPTTPASNNISGFFYLIKVDNGMLIADRMVQQAISWESLNKKNYIYGGVFDTVNSRTVKYVDIRTSTKTYDSSTDSNRDDTHNINPTLDINDAFDEILAPNITDAATYQGWFNDYDKKSRRQRRTQVVCDTTNNVTTTTITVTTWNYAYIPDELPDRIQNAVIDATLYPDLEHDDDKNIDVIRIPFNSELSAISNVLDTVTTVKCTVLKDDGTTYTHDVGVTWSYDLKDKDDNVIGPVYKKGDIGNVIVYGTLADMDIDQDYPMQNPNNIKASCVVMIQSDEIQSIETQFANITVDTDTGAVALKSQLDSTYPSCTVLCKRYGAPEDEPLYQQSNVGIEWDVSNYTPGVVGNTVIVGELTGFESYGLTNTAGIRAEITVITEPVVSGS